MRIISSLGIFLVSSFSFIYSSELFQKPIVSTVDWGGKLFMPEYSGNNTAVYITASFNCVLQSPEHASYELLLKTGALFKKTLHFYTRHLSSSSPKELLENFAYLWSPCEAILENDAPDTNASCVFVYKNTAYCMVRGYNELIAYSTNDRLNNVPYYRPAIADILNRHTYTSAIHSNVKIKRLVPLFGTIPWQPGVALFGYSNTIAKKMGRQHAQYVHSLLQEGKETEPDELIEQIIRGAFGRTTTNRKSLLPCDENAGAFLIRNNI
jgi:hypothetical protein